MLDKIIFGDNQFFGINHMSEEKAQMLSEKFSNLKDIVDIIDFAYDSGIKAFMLNSNERAKEICDYFRDNSARYSDLILYPSIPYPHKFANLVAEKGIFNALKDYLLAGLNMGNFFDILLKGGMAILKNDIFKGMELLVDKEMSLFAGLKIKVIFLQNIVTDLLLGLGIKNIFIEFAEYIKKKYKVEPGFITQNLPALKGFLLECGIKNPIICASINKIGYLVNPNLQAYERTLKEHDFRPIAMSIFASGAIEPTVAIKYVCKTLKIKSVVFGASKKQHILATKKLIENYCA